MNDKFKKEFDDLKLNIEFLVKNEKSNEFNLSCILFLDIPISTHKSTFWLSISVILPLDPLAKL